MQTMLHLLEAQQHKEIKLLTDVSKGRINLEAQLPTKLPLMVGSLGDVPKVVEVSALKYSPWIGRSKAEVESIGLGIKGEKYAKEFQWVYQKGVRGKPLKETVLFIGDIVSPVVQDEWEILK